ncbi:carbohydrate porin [Castellaniella caeni]|uniref:carbohydrate porin n=1 Tax=Castellaniella caeni TaxID=266123 RepID=UPI00082F8173|nr:carbohydrate porin [Castellaniella caeni]
MKANLKFRIASVAGAVVMAACATGAQAYDFSNSPYLLGDWGGLRTSLADKGVTFNLGYGGEAAHNATGGTRHLTRYTDQWVIGTTLDLDKLVGWGGATFQATITDRNGRNLGDDAEIGNNMLLQEVYGRGQTWHLTQFWLEQKLFDERLAIKAGRVTVGEDFFSFSCDFQNLTFCGSQPGNLVGGYWVNWPTSQWGARVKFSPTQDVYGQIGVYQVNPKYVDDHYARHHGLSLDNPSGTTGALIPLEFGWLPSVAGRPGSYKVGVWYNTSRGQDLYEDVNGQAMGVTGDPAREHDGQYGAYLSLQQQITGEPGGRGATVFLNVSQADQATAQVDRQWALGVQYKGPFGRLQDSIGVAVGATHNNGRYADYVHQVNARTGSNTVVGDDYEYAGELYYSWSPVRSVFLRPNVQYVMHPGGTSRNSNAFILGLKTGITF